MAVAVTAAAAAAAVAAATAAATAAERVATAAATPLSHSAHATKYSALKDAAVSRQNAVVSRFESPELSLLSSLL